MSRWLLATGLLLLGVPGCAAGVSEGPPPDVAHYRPQGSGSDAALLTGRLVRDGGCTYVVDGSEVRWVPAFPDDGIAWTDGGLVVGPVRYPLEGSVELGGGEGGRAGVVLPDACDGAAPVWRVAPAQG